jgi:hypothetical protein
MSPVAEYTKYTEVTVPLVIEHPVEIDYVKYDAQHLKAVGDMIAGRCNANE